MNDNVIEFVRPKQPETPLKGAILIEYNSLPDLTASDILREQKFRNALRKHFYSTLDLHTENAEALQNTPEHHYHEHLTNIYRGKAGVRAVIRNRKKIRLVEKSQTILKNSELYPDH